MKKFLATAVIVLLVASVAVAQSVATPTVKEFVGVNKSQHDGATLQPNGGSGNHPVAVGQRVFVQIKVREYIETFFDVKNTEIETIQTPGDEVSTGFRRCKMLYANNAFWTKWYAEVLHRAEASVGPNRVRLNTVDTLRTRYRMALRFEGDAGLEIFNAIMTVANGTGAGPVGGFIQIAQESFLKGPQVPVGKTSIHSLTKGYIYNSVVGQGGLNANAMVPHAGLVYLDFLARAKSNSVAQANGTNHNRSDDAGLYTATVFFVSGIYTMPNY